MTPEELHKTARWVRQLDFFAAVGIARTLDANAFEIERLQRENAELMRDIDTYRNTIGSCSGPCVDHRGNIWEEPANDA